MDIKNLLAQASARGSAVGFAETAAENELPPGIERAKAKIFTPLRLGDLELRHRVVHPAMGRSRSAYGAESPLAAEYFAQRTTPGSLVISQATGVSAESVAWQWAASLHNTAQQSALERVIQAVHGKGGFWFQQLFHVGRCTTPTLVKLARQRAGLHVPSYGYRPVSSSDVAESGFNTHSGENAGIPHPLTIEEIHHIRDQFKKAAQRAVEAGADGIEVLGGNGWLIDQFLHDNINKRTDEYGGSVENRSRFALEVVAAIAEVVGYQRIGIRLSPFSYFHETDGSQPLEQVLHLCHQLILRGIAYIHAGQGRFTRNLSVEENVRRLVAKGIALEDISLRPFRRLLSSTRPTNSLHIKTVLIGNGGYDGASAILSVQEGLADAVSFGRRFISNPDLVRRLQIGYPLTPNDAATFYTHGAEGYTSYSAYGSDQNGSFPKSSTSEEQISSPTSAASDDNDVETPSSSLTPDQAKRRVAIIGAGIGGLASAAALERLGGFDVRIFERRGVPGGFWVNDSASTLKPQVSPGDLETSKLPPLKPTASLPLTVPRASRQLPQTTPFRPVLRSKIPYTVMGDGSTFELSPLHDFSNPFLTDEEISAAIAKKAQMFDHLIQYNTTVEKVEKQSGDRLELTLREENPDNTDTWTLQDFDHLIVTNGHHSNPRVPSLPGLDKWARNLSHSITWHSPKEISGQKILIVGTGDSTLDVGLQSLPHAATPIYISQCSPHPQHPTIFFHPKIEMVSTISHLTTDAVYLSDGRMLTEIDSIVFATGYEYTYPFLSSEIRPPPVAGYRIPAIYQHIFDIRNPKSIAFNGVVDGPLPWVTWEKSAFLIGLLWSGRIHLPPTEVQEAWEARRLEEFGDKNFHVMTKIPDQVVYFDELNELAAEYLHSQSRDDILLRSFPFRWVLELLRARD